MAASNDLRGWVMSAVSGVACVLGSAVICVDVVLRRLTHHKSFQIANSNNFLSASLCLSAGVMLFTSLYSMLPTSKQYLTRAGFSPSASAYILTGLFLAGIVVIRIVSEFIHRFIPSHVVDCAHTHGDPDPERGERGPNTSKGDTERTPLLHHSIASPSHREPAVVQWAEQTPNTGPRPSLRSKLTRRISAFVGGAKPLCDEDGPCFGVSQTCGHECTKVLVPNVDGSPITDETARPALVPHQSIAVQLGPQGRDETDTVQPESADPNARLSDGASAPQRVQYGTGLSWSQSPGHDRSLDSDNEDPDGDPPKSANGNPHHHHVPQNAFLSIGLQTSLAIALHKLPEGFITYATNHASPTLGLTVFLALFIHNIVEGFVMALPLYLALSSRWKAMFWSSLLGGISQPAGAGLAALWIWGSGRHSGHDVMGPSWGVYGGMFAVTAGVMTSVSLQLFSEGLGLTHHRGMGIGFAVAGMGLMGLSFALTA
ncbi:hypothetical protein NUU61_008715 [Penicillium alfredii]|uniref:Zinc/iron permease n=1 Tax=Penicillium alfredii TaxID=1506179 RepID=A0A9W9JWN2_9EURO|nr:uncharacterized protein NUU61_008715 [Penicillium alfredii]KAJ5084136.1 hypothetical protein NUU61_008715 [Penicillium alfredii]